MFPVKDYIIYIGGDRVTAGHRREAHIVPGARFANGSAARSAARSAER